MSVDSPTLSTNLANYSADGLEKRLADLGQPKFRSKQVFRWIWKDGIHDFSSMSNLSREFREKLKSDFSLELPKIVRAETSDDGTIKYLLGLSDGKTVETVWIPRDDQDRVTVCISTQVGCRMGCTFCLTGQQKVERNLLAGEIAGQLMVLPNREKITNVVVMGMGEPFDNYVELMGALEIMTHVEGLNMGPRKITVSTSGLVPAIKRFVQESKCQLAVSLNAPNDEIRSQIMPINRAYNIDTLLGALKEISRHDFPRLRQNKFSITFEYILIHELNDRVEHARELAKRLRGIPCKVNLLLYNENPNVPYKRPRPENVEAFQRVLSQEALLNFVRKSRGRDISAACGQLASMQKRMNIFPGPNSAESRISL